MAALLQRMLKGAVPPVMVKSILPLEEPQLASICVVLNTGPPRLLMVTDAFAAQELASVTVTL